MAKYRLLLLKDKRRKYCFVKDVNAKYFTEHDIRGRRYIVTNRDYYIDGTREKSMRVRYRTMKAFDVYVEVEGYFLFAGNYKDDMNELLRDKKYADKLNNKIDNNVAEAWERIETLRKNKG